ncbi:MAG TPA: acyl-ACP thioesterase domain-containing protein, partial [Solirubrobacter sp.]|nr:acyl-ACP thioesterase domain-containing protein [Solirubrobacter sp.]
MPRDHLRAEAHDQQQRRVGRVPERLVTDLQLAGAAEGLGHHFRLVARTLWIESLPEFPRSGRAFAEPRLVGPGDTAPDGRARLDALADWLQAVAYADVVDAGLQDAVLWVVRRVALRITRFPVLGERVELRTACSALGARWAERRTRVTGPGGGGGARVEAVALWVAIDPRTLRPARIDALADVYGESAGDRRVRTGLLHPPPPAD